MYAMLMLIVLVFSNTQVHAQITDAPSEVQGSGTEQDPYIIAVSGGTGGKVVIKPEKVPFYFKVRGTGGVGGVFAIDYDIEKGLVSFQMTDTVTVTGDGGTNYPIVVDENLFAAKTYQLGTSPYLQDEVDIPKYDISEEYKQLFPGFNGAYYTPSGATWNESDTEEVNVPGGGTMEVAVVKRTTKLSNVKASVVTGANYEKTDLYVLVREIYSRDDIIQLFKASGYSYDKNDPDAGENYYLVFRNLSNTVKVPDDGCILDAGSKSVSIIYKFNGLTNTALGEAADEHSLEALISRVFMAFGDVLLYMIQKIFGKDLTINSLIFNTYDDTKLNFYSSNPNGLSQGLADVVNYWYKVFSTLAYVLYVVILVYIGIMIVVSSGTGDQDKRKKSLGDWFVGLAIMFAVPTFVIPSLIKLNDAFVKFMSSKNSAEITTYYNSYVTGTDILGGDSETLSIEELMQMRQETSKELANVKEEQEKMLDDLIQRMLDEAGRGTMADARREETVRNMFDNIIRSMRYYLSGKSKRYSSLDECINSNVHYAYQQVVVGMPDSLFRDVLLTYCVPGASNFEKMISFLKDIAELEQQINNIDQLVEIKKTDLMTIMRTYAGKYNRMVFVMVWFLLLFQMIAMIFIYYKRVFVIAILITIFPLVMIFYCIDKMADGSAQTLSMWFKELISDIFIQSIHCVMYVVLVQMGLQVYKNDPSNWFIFLAAMLLLVPAERMMKEIFGLNTSSLGQLGGMGMNVAMGIGAAVKLGKMGLKRTGNLLAGKKDKAFVQRQNARFAKIQARQTRADTRAQTRQNRRQLKGKAPSKQRLYHAATNIRRAKAKVLPVVARAGKATKDAVSTVAALGYGAYSAISGEGMAGFYAGVSMAEKASGVNDTKVSGKKAIIKTELSSAYSRKAKGGAASTSTSSSTSGTSSTP